MTPTQTLQAIAGEARRIKLADVMKVYRWTKHLTVRELAREIGISAATLNRFENGTGDLSGECLAKVLRWMLS